MSPTTTRLADFAAITNISTPANGTATKIFLPADFASGLGGLAAVAELFKSDDGGDEGRAFARAQHDRHAHAQIGAGAGQNFCNIRGETHGLLIGASHTN